MNPILFTMPDSAAFSEQLRGELACDTGDLQIRRFPDQESCPRFHTDVGGRDVIIVSELDQPDEKIVRLYLTACVARELGARSVGFVIPYLPYMRQDARFEPGEGITSLHFARLISSCCDWLVTVGPHLQRHRAISEIYNIPCTVVQAAPLIARWVAENILNPVIFGSDVESEPWIATLAEAADCPYVLLNKLRHSNDNVEVSIPDASFWVGMTPVLVDDVVSTARTMIAAALRFEREGMAPPVCLAVHPLFAGDAYIALCTSGVDRIVSCNTVTHASNKINLCQPIAAAATAMLSSIATARI